MKNIITGPLPPHLIFVLLIGYLLTSLNKGIVNLQVLGFTIAFSLLMFGVAWLAKKLDGMDSEKLSWTEWWNEPRLH